MAKKALHVTGVFRCKCGALVLGPKNGGEPYGPDESAAIAQLAHSVGVALDILGAHTAGANEEICASLRSLEALSRAANDALRLLPDAIAERMRQRASDAQPAA